MSVNPATALGSNDFSGTLIEAEEALNDLNTVVKVTFWGQRVIEVQNAFGDEVNVMGLIVSSSKKAEFALNDIAQKVWNAERDRRGNLTQAEREAGQKIIAKIQEFYTETDRQVKAVNWFTRLLLAIRELPLQFSFPTLRFHIEDRLPNEFFARRV